MMFDASLLTSEAIRLVQAHLDELTSIIGLPRIAVPREPIQRRIGLLCQAANGDLGECRGDGTDEAVSAAWDDTLKLLTSSAAAWDEHTEGFWQSPVGELLLHARLWLDCDRLITLSEAAMQLRGSAKKRDLIWINAQIKYGRLTRYSDPTEPNSTKAGRVSLAQVEALKHE